MNLQPNKHYKGNKTGNVIQAFRLEVGLPGQVGLWKKMTFEGVLNGEMEPALGKARNLWGQSKGIEGEPGSRESEVGVTSEAGELGRVQILKGLVGSAKEFGFYPNCTGDPWDCLKLVIWANSHSAWGQKEHFGGCWSGFKLESSKRKMMLTLTAKIY